MSTDPPPPEDALTADATVGRRRERGAACNKCPSWLNSPAKRICLVTLISAVHFHANLFTQISPASDDEHQMKAEARLLEELPPPTFPPVCTDLQLVLTANVQHRQTQCPDATWLRNESDTQVLEHPRSEYSILLDASRGRNPLAIFIGCNKGIDAVDNLRFLTQDARYDKARWVQALGLSAQDSRGACKAGTTEQSLVEPEKFHPRPGTLHCVEAMPSNFQILDRAAQTLGWNDTLIVHHAAASDANGSILFPNAAPGTEWFGIGDCQTKPGMCENVTMVSLDTFYREKVEGRLRDNHQPIVDFLSIDAEGYDPAVLRGGSLTLSKTKYLEFEVNAGGVWATTRLSDVVASLRESNFVCYYAGKGGNLWRLTDCMAIEGKREWSNVACANVRLAPRLAEHMEAVYLKTISDRDIYNALCCTMIRTQSRRV